MDGDGRLGLGLTTKEEEDEAEERRFTGPYVETSLRRREILAGVRRLVTPRGLDAVVAAVVDLRGRPTLRGRFFGGSRSMDGDGASDLLN